MDCFVGAIDYSFNEHESGRYPSHWFEHFYGVTLTKDPEKLRVKLQRQFSRTDTIPRPVTITSWDGGIVALRYALKSRFWRRIGLDQVERVGRSGEKRTSRDTNKQPLRSKQKLELLLHLDEIGLHGRLFMRHAQLLNLRGSGPTIVVKEGELALVYGTTAVNSLLGSRPLGRTGK